jgi:carotenoid cleavage dioxygenase-like enzyme
MFVPNPKSTAEDDGVLISCVTDTTHPTSKDFILFLDAKTMKELGRAQFKEHIPQVK